MRLGTAHSTSERPSTVTVEIYTKFRFQDPISEDLERSTYSLRFSRSSPCIALKVSVQVLSKMIKLTFKNRVEAVYDMLG